jgi:hypothetical protein
VANKSSKSKKKPLIRSAHTPTVVAPKGTIKMNDATTPAPNVSTMYVTQGTVQVEFYEKAQTKALALAVRINPVQDFTVKLCKEDCIVFVKEEFQKPDNKAKQADAKVFKKTQEFVIDPDCSTFQQVLIDAAREGTKIEIKISVPAPPDKNQPVEDIKIVSIKIPATLRADTV